MTRQPHSSQRRLTGKLRKASLQKRQSLGGEYIEISTIHPNPPRGVFVYMQDLEFHRPWHTTKTKGE